VNSSLASYVAVALGAAAGGVLRYAITMAFVARFGPGLPLGTFFINLSGSFLIGLIAELSLTRALGIGPLVRLALTVGVLGGYTTFSSFSFEALTLTGERENWLALAYAVASVVLGVGLCYSGVVLARLMVRPA